MVSYLFKIKYQQTLLRILAYIFTALLLLFYILPNIFNKREEAAFSDEARLQRAGTHFNIRDLADSTEVSISEFYDRGDLVKSLFGEHYRQMWGTSIRLPVLQLDTVAGGLTFVEAGGGEQTLSIELKNSDSLTYSLRSVNKDQSHALPSVLRYSALRPLFRDQTAALNPFGALIADNLEHEIHLLHTHPTMYLVPYDSGMARVLRQKIAGRVMILEEEPDNSWAGTKTFSSPVEIISSEEMIQRCNSGKLKIDSLGYLRARLLDILMSDWDRHDGQWAWAVYHTSDDSAFCKPIAMDRDMAFYKFDDGMLNKFTLLINNKFQSFKPTYDDISGLMKNSKELDQYILKNVPEKDFITQSKVLKETLNDDVITTSFQSYPTPVWEQYGKEHTSILKSRRDRLEEAARKFYSLLHH